MQRSAGLRPGVLGIAVTLAVALFSNAASAVDARLMRYPDVSANQIAFVYAGDIWVVPKTGGAAPHKKYLPIKNYPVNENT